MTATKFEAGPAAAGYIYQARLALLLCMRYVNKESNIEVSVERLDDVSFEQNGSPLELLQAKHHISRIASLSDFSADLWKTLRVWANKVAADPSLPSRTRLTLVTTGSAPQGSAAALLRPEKSYPAGESRDPKKAEELLSAVAAVGVNKGLQSSYNAFLALDPKMRASLLSAVDVLDNQKLVDELGLELEEALRIFAPKGKAVAAVEMLEGWWWGRIASAIITQPAGQIAIAQLEAKLDEIREMLKRDALNMDFADADLPMTASEEYEELNFVCQLKAIKITEKRVQWAKRDYYRAFSQRSKWAREHALYDGELAKFELRLIEEWEPRYEAMRVKHKNAASDCDSLCEAGQELYFWVETNARVPLRSLVDRSLSVGSYHILANDIRLGWHRDYPKLFGSTEP